MVEKHWIIVIYQAFHAFIYLDTAAAADEFYADLSQPSELLKSGVFYIAVVLGDSLVASLFPSISTASCADIAKLRYTGCGSSGGETVLSRCFPSLHWRRSAVSCTDLCKMAPLTRAGSNLYWNVIFHVPVGAKLAGHAVCG
jgi:hypothetical protein